MTSEQLTNGAAVAAVISPAWLPYLQTVSTVAALMLPIFGVFWLMVQISVRIFTVRRGSRNKGD